VVDDEDGSARVNRRERASPLGARDLDGCAAGDPNRSRFPPEAVAYSDGARATVNDMNSKLTTAAHAFEFYLKAFENGAGVLPVRSSLSRRRGSPASSGRRGTWTEDNLLRQVVYEGLRKDKPAREVRRKAPRPKPDIDGRAADAKTHVARQRRS